MLRNEELMAKAEVYHGDEICRDKSRELLEEVGLPRGLLPLHDIVECGFIEETGFVWLRQKNKIEHYFPKAGRRVSYGEEITAYVEKQRIRKLTGVKGKELLMWLTISDISIDDSPPASRLLTCQTPSGIVRSFPASAFDLPEDHA
ncbi:hypothetical protein LUZ61_000035 [Rhynchospora tenuis]|uniref:DUF538 domain-containing protein n=1 Tax=Rhynchospora tenuis TaxID=198213 RepID=A0AAD5ZEI2_9POAL|nr:hypothetical protein LUZ61_021036 [Rhynchospora tenuis]KAJ3696330.1 hypothetical protein LUZ61_000035 [Rhynchospora tenuis]